MEPWQITHITKNLPDLLSLTICNAKLLAKLGAAELLADSDVKTIKAERNQHDKATLMYDILKTRTNGYHGLIRALIATKQSGAVKILLQLSPNKIGSLKISLQDAVHLVNELLTEEEIQAISAWIKNNLSMDECLKIHESIQAAETLELVRDTIPKPHALYIPRFLSRRLGVNPDLFDKPCSDVFVFKEIEQSKLRKFIKSNECQSTCEQLLQKNITSRFLILDCDADWKRICNNVKSPAHLIKFEESTETFVLEATTGGSSAICPYLQHQHDSSSELVSEDKFLEMFSIDNVRGVCICDIPGMGKSLLLTNLARKAREKWPERVVSFIQLQNVILKSDSTFDDITLKTLELISSSLFATQILYKLCKRHELQLELFFDGLDEVQHVNLDHTTAFLKMICQSMPNTKIYVTSRPVVRAELEKAMCMIAYDIQPFNEETQLNYLTKHWAQTEPKTDRDKLDEYAVYCIRGFQQTLTNNERNIAGVPLICWLLAEVYVEKAATYADTTRKTNIKLPENFVSSLYEIYKKLFARQLGETKCKFACMFKYDLFKPVCDIACLTYSFHVWQALKLIVPNYSLDLEISACHFGDLIPCQILTPGVLDENKRTETYVFMHRTFAEYLVAEYFAKNFLWELGGVQATSYLNPQINFSGLNEVLMTDKIWINTCLRYKHGYHRCFRENVVLHFLDAMISTSCENVALCNASISPFNVIFLKWIEGCLHGNLHGLLNLLLQTAANYKSELPMWPIQVYRKVLCFWTSFNKQITSVVHKALLYCDTDTVENLLQFFKNMYNPNWMKIRKDENSLSKILQQAMIRGDYELVRYLVERFPFTLNKDVFENWFLDTCEQWESEEKNEGNKKEAKHENHIKILDVIFTHKSSLIEERYWGSTFLFDVVGHRKLEIIKFLVSREVIIFAVDRVWGTILHKAAIGGDEDFFREILRILGKNWVNGPANASLNCFVSKRAPNNVRKPETSEHLFNWHTKRTLQTPLHCAIENLKDMQLETLDLLLAGGNEKRVEARRYKCVNVDAVDLFGKTALHMALACQRLELVKHLIARGADWTLKTKNGCNAVHICAYRGSEQHLKYFLELGCNVNELDLKGNNALQCALDKRWMELDTWNNIISNNVPKAKILIHAGINISNKNLKGKTARKLAVLNGWPEDIVKLL